MRLLLDVHIPRAVAHALRADQIDAESLAEWHEGVYRTAPDDLILGAAFVEQRVLVTYDVRTIPGLLRAWSFSDRHHAGVIFADRHTVQPNDIGGLVRALTNVIRDHVDDDWQDQVRFLSAE